MEKTMEAHVMEREIEFFNKNGYLAIEDVIAPEVCDQLLSLFKGHAKKIGNNTLESMPQIHKEIPEALDVMKDKTVVSMIEAVLGGEAVGIQSVCVFKKPGTPSGKHAWNPHQDGTYLNLRGKGTPSNQYVSGNIALDDHLPDSGCLYVYPESHLEELLPYEPHRSFNIEENTNPGNKVIDIPKKYERVDLHLKKGSLLSFHGHLIHGSYENTSQNNWRPVLLQAYMRKGANFDPGETAKRVPVELR